MNTDHAARLLVLHRPKDPTGQGLDKDSAALLRSRGFFLDTCLRQLAVIAAPDCSGITMQDSQVEHLADRKAYSFLLQTAAGLNSSIPGESNILGQFKRGWNNWRQASNAEQVCQLNRYMHELFLDSRRIRRDYLQGIGGNSYGSLVRKLLHPAQDARILFVGTGELTRSMLPLFDGFSTALWNHRRTASQELQKQHWFKPEAARQAAGWATHIVITTPADNENDQAWADMAGSQVQHVAHLSRRRAAAGIWSDLSHDFRFSCLDDIFDLRREQSSLRSLQIVRARKACEQRAANFHSGPHNLPLSVPVIAQSA